MKTYTIDAKNKILGRVASEVAALLRGKGEVDFAPNLTPKVKVEVLNINDLKVSGDKLNTKIYTNYSGYPGGLKTTTIGKVLSTKGKGMGYSLRRAVMGMLPKNKLRAQMIKNLIIK